jgi:Helix-turn-helix domain
MTHPRNAPPAGADAERAAFLRDLRALRDQAGLQARDLAARAHYPEDTLKTAEDGPALPSLPVLEAYVRGCGARPSDWEDRWRRLTLSEEAERGSALPTRAPTANRPPTSGANTGPVGLSAAEQAALAPGLARVAAGLGPTTVAADADSWFARPDMATSGSAADPSASAPSAASGPSAPSAASGPSAPYAASAPSAQSALSAPSGAGQGAPEGGAAWHRPDPGPARPPADSGTAWPPADSGTAWPPADSGTAWPPADSGTARPTAERGSPVTGQPSRPAQSPAPQNAAPQPAAPRSAVPQTAPRSPAAEAAGGSGGHARAQKSTARLNASVLPAASEPGRRPTRRVMTGIMLLVAALLVVAVVLWLALAS